jgi:hypothetical protein
MKKEACSYEQASFVLLHLYSRLRSFRKDISVNLIDNSPIQFFSLIVFDGDAYAMSINIVDHYVIVAPDNSDDLIPFSLIEIYPVIIHTSMV